MHCEILATASADRSWRAWSFSPDVTTAREASPNTFVGCPGTEWGRSAYADFRTDVAIGARLIGEWTEYTAPIIKGEQIMLRFCHILLLTCTFKLRPLVAMSTPSTAYRQLARYAVIPY